MNYKQLKNEAKKRGIKCYVRSGVMHYGERLFKIGENLSLETWTLQTLLSDRGCFELENEVFL